MATTWYVLLAFMLAVYAVLDGFDLGVGALHGLVARSDEERRTVLAAIGPVWDGNEVWLVASGGVLVFAFPRVYAAVASGLYLPVMLILWLLVLRGLAIELRSLVEDPLWRQLWDATFGFASTLLALVFGVALGNVVRGVPLDARGWFHLSWSGVLDGYTLTVGALALALLMAHGAAYLAWKTEGPVHDRSLRAAGPALVAALALFGVATAATFAVQPLVIARLAARPLISGLAAAVVAALVLALVLLRRRRERALFFATSGAIAALLALCAATLYPTLLPSTIAPAHALTVAGAASGRHGLATGLLWWIPALLLAIAYFAYLFGSFRGKVRPEGAH